MGIIAGDGIHLHSWGSIFIQDVVMPLRKRPLTPAQHIRLLRLSIVGVAVWAFLFGALVPQIKYVQFWWAITEAIFVSGAGVAIIGGLYWSRGTNAGAWLALVVGAILACIGIGTEFYYERFVGHPLNVPLPYYDLHLHLRHFPFHLSVPTICFYDSLVAIACYLVVSCLTCRTPHNMDKLLHRGAYGVQGDAEPAAPSGRKHNWLYRVVTFGIDEQFSRSDRWITISITLWSMFWFLVFIVVSLWCVLPGVLARMGVGCPFQPWTAGRWASYYLWTGIYMPLAIGAVTTVWFTWGCTHDMVVFFRRLRGERIDEQDDGTVIQDDESPKAPAAAAAGGGMDKGK
jgi:SSS family solute:Na+ symporter